MDVPPMNGASAQVAVGPVMVPAESVPDRRGVVACMSQSVRASTWVLPRLFRAVALMGQVDLDLTRVQLGAGTSDIQILACIGQVNIIVPHNLHVECDGDSFMGEFRLRRETDAIPSPDAPTIRISGTAVMGSVHVKVIDPAVPNWRDKWRAKRFEREQRRMEREQRRLERKGLRG
jgi:hypothetical protein